MTRLDPQQCKPLLSNELCNIQRRDNLTATLHMITEAVFWFHPLIWWIGSRLVDERERACDEEVLRLGNEPRVYAEGILNVCKLCIAPPLICMSGITGSNLKRRVEDILNNRRAENLSFSRAVLLIFGGIAALGGPLAIGSIQQSESLRFDVASIRPIPPGTKIQAQALGIACRGSDGSQQAVIAVMPQVDPVLASPRGRCNANGVTLQS